MSYNMGPCYNGTRLHKRFVVVYFVKVLISVPNGLIWFIKSISSEFTSYHNLVAIHLRIKPLPNKRLF